MLSLLDYTRSEPQDIRRGYKWKHSLQLFIRNSDGKLVAQSLTGFTITPGLRQTEAKDGTAVSGVTISATTVDSAAGRFDVTIPAADTPTLVKGKTYFWYVYVNHATITGGSDELIRIGAVRVPA